MTTSTGGAGDIIPGDTEAMAHTGTELSIITGLMADTTRRIAGILSTTTTSTTIILLFTIHGILTCIMIAGTEAGEVQHGMQEAIMVEITPVILAEDHIITARENRPLETSQQDMMSVSC